MAFVIFLALIIILIAMSKSDNNYRETATEDYAKSTGDKFQFDKAYVEACAVYREKYTQLMAWFDDELKRCSESGTICSDSDYYTGSELGVLIKLYVDYRCWYPEIQAPSVDIAKVPIGVQAEAARNAVRRFKDSTKGYKLHHITLGSLKTHSRMGGHYSYTTGSKDGTYSKTGVDLYNRGACVFGWPLYISGDVKLDINSTSYKQHHSGDSVRDALKYAKFGALHDLQVYSLEIAKSRLHDRGVWEPYYGFTPMSEGYYRESWLRKARFAIDQYDPIDSVVKKLNGSLKTDSGVEPMLADEAIRRMMESSFRREDAENYVLWKQYGGDREKMKKDLRLMEEEHEH